MKDWETFLQMVLPNGRAFRLSFLGDDPDGADLDFVIKAIRMLADDAPVAPNRDLAGQSPRVMPGAVIGEWALTHDPDDYVLFAESPKMSLKFYDGEALTIMPESGANLRLPASILRALIEDAQKRGV